MTRQPAAIAVALALCSCGVVEPRGESATASLVIDNNADKLSTFSFDYKLDGFRVHVTTNRKLDANEAIAIEGAFAGTDRERMTVTAEVVTGGISRVNDFVTTLPDGGALGFAYSFDELGNFQMKWKWDHTGAPRRQR